MIIGKRRLKNIRVELKRLYSYLNSCFRSPQNKWAVKLSINRIYRKLTRNDTKK